VTDLPTKGNGNYRRKHSANPLKSKQKSKNILSSSFFKIKVNGNS